ncbi:MAG TPA: hypothetical protein VJ111_05970 [Chitinophagaceae bacterium]|nr:hypothetical protein [Chitinophagaceae bacterium]
MKKALIKYSSFTVAFLIAYTGMAQKDSLKPFKDIYKTQETDRHLEKEIKKQELQKTPAKLCIDTMAMPQIIKKEIYWRKEH